MLAGVGAVALEEAELRVVGVEGFEAVEEGEGFGGMAKLALDPGEVETGWGLAGVGLDEAVEEVDGFFDLAGGGVENGEVGKGGGLVGVLL